MSKPKNKIELLPAFRWICDICAHENFSAVHDAKREFVDELIQDMEEEGEIQPFQKDEAKREIEEGVDQTYKFLYNLPGEVTCSNCQNTFETEWDDESEEGGGYGVETTL